MKRFLCVFSSFVIALTCFGFSVSAVEPPKGYEIGECVFDDEDFKSFMDSYMTKYPNKGITVDEDGFYYIPDEYSSQSASLRGFLTNPESEYYYVEYIVGSGVCLTLMHSPFIDSSLSGFKVRHFSGSGNGFTYYDSSSLPTAPVIKLNASSIVEGYKVKTIRFYALNLSGTKGLKNVGSSFGFMLGGVRDFITIVSGYPVLLLGIALFCCGCAVSVYYRLRS